MGPARWACRECLDWEATRRPGRGCTSCGEPWSAPDAIGSPAESRWTRPSWVDWKRGSRAAHGDQSFGSHCRSRRWRWHRTHPHAPDLARLGPERIDARLYSRRNPFERYLAISSERAAGRAMVSHSYGSTDLVSVQRV